MLTFRTKRRYRRATKNAHYHLVCTLNGCINILHTTLNAAMLTDLFMSLGIRTCGQIGYAITCPPTMIAKGCKY